MSNQLPQSKDGRLDLITVPDSFHSVLYRCLSLYSCILVFNKYIWIILAALVCAAETLVKICLSLSRVYICCMYVCDKSEGGICRCVRMMSSSHTTCLCVISCRFSAYLSHVLICVCECLQVTITCTQMCCF